MNLDEQFRQQVESYRKRMMKEYYGKIQSEVPEAVPTVQPVEEEPSIPAAQREAQPKATRETPPQERELTAAQIAAQMGDTVAAMTHGQPGKPSSSGGQFDSLEDTQDISADQSLEQFLAVNQGEGYLKIAVTTGQKSIPLSGAKCVVSKVFSDGKKHIFYTVVTDEDGLAGPLALPAPNRSLSGQPSLTGVLPYANYDMTVEMVNYVPVSEKNIPVFDGIISIQSVDMVPETLSNSIPPQIVDETSPNRL